MQTARKLIQFSVLVALALGFQGCALERFESLGRAPPLNPPAEPNSEIGRAVYMPMSPPEAGAGQANSLWRPGSRTFFRDPRAAKVGDILTVDIDIGDAAQIANTTTQSRAASEAADLSKLLGFDTKLTNILPDAADSSDLVDFGSDSSTTGTGSVNRSESIQLTVAAVVTQVLPNGNLVIQGQQEVRVNYEVRELTISGIVRPEDITNANTIEHTQIAEARISYGGRGTITNLQQPRYGQQIFDIIFPF